MYILGIETSCDDTAAAVIKAEGGLNPSADGPFFSVLSNLSYSQVATHRKFGGVVPNLASRDHLKKIIPVIKKTLESAFGRNIRHVPNIATIMKKIDLIAVTKGPGLAPSLLVGINTARALAYAWQKPVIGVNHIEGHIYSNWLTPVGVKFKNPARTTGIVQSGGQKSRPNDWYRSVGRAKIKIIEFPALILIVSGGHTELVLMKNYGKYKIIGRTRDDAAGEAFDKTARLLGLKYPGGPEIARLADRGTLGKFSLPKPMIDSKDYDFSFSGLKTAVLYEFQKNKKTILNNLPDFAATLQSSIVDVLVAKTLKAARAYKPKTVMIAGGVAANKNLREKMAETFESLKIPSLVPEMPYTTDNAAMIAACGYFRHLIKKTEKDSWKKIEMDANLTL